MRVERVLAFAGALAVGGVVAGCYQAQLAVPQPDPLTTACHRTVHTIAWGLITHDTKTTYCESQDRKRTCKEAGGGDSTVQACVQQAEAGRQPTACEQSNAIDQVQVSGNFGYTLLSVLTLGFWSPVELKWRCSKPAEGEGEVNGGPPPAPDRGMS
jgi:hypothetical protein